MTAIAYMLLRAAAYVAVSYVLAAGVVAGIEGYKDAKDAMDRKKRRK